MEQKSKKNKHSFSLFDSLTFFCEKNNIKSDFMEKPEALKIKEMPVLTYFSVPEQLEQKSKQKK